MNVWSRHRPASRWLAGLLLGGLGALGCGGSKEAPAPEAPEAGPVVEARAEPKGEVKGAPAAPARPARDRLHQAFVDATRNADSPPADAVKPPDETVTKKPAFRLLEEVARAWDTVRFTTADGRSIAYTAVLETSEGEVQIALFGDQAPNHVRNFICLARAGYYDQLFFDRCCHEEVNGQSLRALEGGCPRGTGETITGSIGYWLKDELTAADKMTHEEGTLGACRSEEADTAATRFYITLDKAPFLDGNFTLFGKVVQGLDIVRRIYAKPVVAEDRQRDGARRPEQPVVIRKVTIHAKELEAKPK